MSEDMESRDHAQAVGSVTSGQPHSPGPWKTDNIEGCWIVVDAADQVIAQVKWWDNNHERDDARLMAASPRMLAALKAVKSGAEYVDELGDIIDAAIAQAETGR